MASPSERKWQGKRCVICTLYRGGWYFGIVSYFQYLHNTKWLTMNNLASRNTEKNTQLGREVYFFHPCVYTAN